MSNHDPINSTTTMTTGDPKDVSLTTTTTVVYNSVQPPPQTSTSPTINQQTKTESNHQLSPIMYRHQTGTNQQYLSPQHVIQTPSTNMNETRLNMQIPTIR